MFSTINNKQVAIDISGEGDATLLVHGLGGSSNFWTPIINEFSSNFKLIAPDLPASARSDNDPDLSIESLAKDMLTLLDELEITQAHVVGHSMGTIVCQHMAVLAPERVKDLVLLGPLAAPPDPARAALKDRAELARKEGMTSIADTIANVALSTETKSLRPVAVGFVRELLMRQNPEGYALSCIALSEAQAAKAESISCKTLLITGDEDGVAPPANVEKLDSALPNSSMTVLEGCGHWTATEKPSEVNALIRNFYGI